MAREAEGLYKPELTQPSAYSSSKAMAITKTSRRPYITCDKAPRNFLIYLPQIAAHVAITPIPCHPRKSGLTPTCPR